MVITGDNTSILICCNNNTEDTERYKMQNLCTDLTSAAAAAAAAGRQTDTHRQPTGMPYHNQTVKEHHETISTKKYKSNVTLSQN